MRYDFLTHSWRAIILGLSLGGCSSLPHAPPPFDITDAETRHCFALYQSLNKVAEATETVDARHARVPGMPFLRTSRFWASFDPHSMDSAAYRAWLRHQNVLAVEGLTLEWLRLREDRRRALVPALPDSRKAVEQTLTACGNQLVNELSVQPRLAQIKVKDHYQTWKRWLGVYPLMAAPFYRGVVKEHDELSQRQTQFAEQMPVTTTGDWHFFGGQRDDPTPTDGLTLLSQRPVDPLGIPIVDSTTQRQLLDAFRPTIAIQMGNARLAGNDRPIRLSLNEEGQLQNDPSRPTLYTDLSLGRYRDQTTIQLTYSVWFSERRSEGALDLLAGRYNGVTWRVHLLPSGAVIGFDKMHLCGCWYQFFPAMGFKPRPDLPFTQEPLHLGDSVDPRARQTLWLASNTHHLLGVSAGPEIASGERWEFLPYDSLRAISRAGTDRHVSPFDEEGLLPESERLERWVFWPMGIRSPGALRLFGTHATAFIGRRHFDDPGLLDELGL